jgi:hypothetical protein
MKEKDHARVMAATGNPQIHLVTHGLFFVWMSHASKITSRRQEQQLRPHLRCRSIWEQRADASGLSGAQLLKHSQEIFPNE